MNICVYGAGALGSLFAALLSKKNHVFCIARKQQINAVKTSGLSIIGKTSFHNTLPFYQSIKELPDSPDLIILTVKSYDTSQAAEEISSILSENTVVLSLQNGLNNIESLLSLIPNKNVLAGITSHGALLLQPGIIKHTGIGKTRMGEINGILSKRLRDLQLLFMHSGIAVDISTNIKKDIWRKAIVNASINPLTALFQCQNGYLIKNPLLEDIVVRICEESTTIAQNNGFDITVKEMIDYTAEVIKDTKENQSSMLQSIRQQKKTEIEAINGAFCHHGKNTESSIFFNDLLTHIIQLLNG